MSDDLVGDYQPEWPMIERLAVDPGDVIVLRSNWDITMAQAVDLKAWFIRETGLSNRVVVLGPAVEIKVMGADDD